MRAELRRSIFLACVGLLAGFALVVTLYGAGTMFKQGLAGRGAPEDQAVPLAAPLGDGAAGPGSAAPSPVPAPIPAPAPAPAGEGGTSQPGKPRAALEGQPGPDRGPASPQGEAPSFDIIRIEPSGEAVIAGRAPPNTTVELLRDNGPIARALVDPSGQFAIVPPALPPGTSEITLRVTGADGRARVSRDSVSVVVAANRTAKPLIALTSPDKPTIVLSQPDPVAAPPAQAGTGQAATAKPGSEKPGAGMAGTGKTPGKAPGSTAGTTPDADRLATNVPGAAGGKPEADKSAPVKIVSVEAEEGGRLYVTSQARPGATVRLYLNDTLVAPGSAGADGRVSFTIGRGVRPGDYRIRVDQVDPVTGTVKTRSEVAFAVPASVARPDAATGATPPPAQAQANAQAQARIRDRAEHQAQAPEGRPASPAGAPARTEPPAPPAGAPGALAAIAPPIPAVPPIPARPPNPAVPTNPAVSPNQAVPPNRASHPAEPPSIGSPAAGAARPAPEAGPSTGTPTVYVPEIGTARIVRGDSLWQISRRIYGKGTRYTVIFDANQPQIRNPDLIYPGQIFVLPSDGTAVGTQDDTRG